MFWKCIALLEASRQTALVNRSSPRGRNPNLILVSYLGMVQGYEDRIGQNIGLLVIG